MSVPTKEELMRLKDLTMMTGELSEVQILQLKMWPRVILGATAAEVEFDANERSLTAILGRVSHKAVTEGSKEDFKILFDRRMEKFNQAVKWLLGDDYTVRIYSNNHKLAEFMPLVGIQKAHPPRPEGKKNE